MDRNTLIILGRDVARLLKYPQVHSDEGSYNPAVDLFSGDSLGLGVRIHNGRTDGRLSIEPLYGKLGEYLPRMETRLSITVSAGKTAAQIAHDIETRLFPGLRAVLLEAGKCRDATMAYTRKTADTADRMREAGGGKLEVKMPDSPYHNSDYRPTLYANSTVTGVYLSADVSGDTVHFNHLTLTADQAERVFRALFSD